MFFSRKKNEIKYNPETQIAVVKCSICTGERVAGFKDKKTGQFMDVMLIRSDSDLDLFMKKYGLNSITKEY